MLYSYIYKHLIDVVFIESITNTLYMTRVHQSSVLVFTYSAY